MIKSDILKAVFKRFWKRFWFLFGNLFMRYDVGFNWFLWLVFKNVWLDKWGFGDLNGFFACLLFLGVFLSQTSFSNN